MAFGAEAFTVMAILEAKDRASEVFARLDESLDKFSGTAKSAADSARAAGSAIDESLLQTASGADALDLADARVAAAQARVAAASRDQAAAERELLAAQDGDAGAEDRQVAAADRLAAAQARVTAATRQLSDAERIQSGTAEASAAKTDLAGGAAGKAGTAAEGSAAGFGAMGKTAGIVAGGMAIAGAVMIKAAGNFQDSTTHLVTDAGESAKNLAMVQAGILQVSSATGTSAADITNAMYHIESGGYHGAAGLKMLQIAAEGAKVGGADLDTVSRTLVGTMNAYGLSASHSATMMNQLIATVGAGDMRMQDLASSLSAVTPVAAAAHLSFAQVGGALATMTSQGMTAQQATQDLAHMIRSLQSPNAVAANEMRALGLNANQVSRNLGKAGLTGTIGTLTQAILSNTSGGNVMLGYYKLMTPQAQSMATAIASGTITTGALTKAMKTLTPQQAALVTQFKTSADSATGLKQTFTAAMQKMTGGATGLNVALMLGGGHAKAFAANVRTVEAAAKKAGDHVDNWSTIQGTFNFKLASAKTAVENTGIAIGSALLPAATAILGVIARIVTPIAEWTSKHRTLTLILFGGVIALTATIAAVSLAHKAFSAIKGAVTTVRDGFGALKTALGAVKSAASALPGVMNSVGSAFSSIGSSIGSVASSAGSAISAAAQTAAGWAQAGAKAVWAAGRFLAVKTAQLAVAVATRIWSAAQAIFNVIMDANPIMLVVIAIAALAAGIYYAYTHFAAFRQIVADVFGWLKTAVTDVIHFVTAHWKLILEILTGPIGLAVLLITKYWKDIKKYFETGVNNVRAILAWFGSLPGLFGRWIGGAVNAIVSTGKHILDWFGALPGKIVGFLAGLPGMLYNAGIHVMQSLINGLMSMLGNVGSAVSGIASKVAGFFGLSPAKEGPLSGGGAPEIRGAHFVDELARGMGGRKSALHATMNGLLAGAALTATGSLALAGGAGGGGLPALTARGGGAGAAGGGSTVIIDLRGAHVMSDSDITKLTNRIGSALATRGIPQSGVRIR